MDDLALAAVGQLAFPDLTAPSDSLLGGAVKGAGLTVWTAAMSGLWSAGLWLLRLAFTILDALTTPDLSADGPLRSTLQTTLWIGASVAGLLLLLQLGVVAVRRDGKSLARLLLGLAQFGFVWLTFLAVAAAAVTAAGALRRGILRATLGVDTMAAVTWTEAWPRDVVDAATATVLGVTSLCLVIPGAFFHILVALVSLAAWLVLVACTPLTAAGLLHETARGWFWKSTRWSVACVLIAPCEALVLGIGVQVSGQVVEGAGDDVGAVGTAVVGAALVMVGACCPLALFRLLAFIDPGTPSGAAVRQTWQDAGGVTGLFRGNLAGGAQQGGGSSTAVASDGRARGEEHAESQAMTRFSGMLGTFGQGVRTTTAFATRATDLAADILGAAGVGSPSYSMTPADERALRSTPRSRPEGDGRAPSPGPGTAPAPRPGGGDALQPPAGSRGGPGTTAGSPTQTATGAGGAAGAGAAVPPV